MTSKRLSQDDYPIPGVEYNEGDIMSENTSDEGDNYRTERSISIDNVLEPDHGEEVAVRVSINGSEQILAGRFTSEPATRAEINEKLDEIDLR